QRPFPAPERVLNSVIAAEVSGETPGYAVLVSRDGKILWEAGFGMANLATKEAVTPGTVFRIGSITKQFVASAVLLCEEEGRFSVNDPLSRFFPDYPGGDKITLKHLLTHTSGIKSYTSLPDFMTHVKEPRTPEQMMAGFQNLPPDFAPGAGFAYCNSGYFLLAEVVRRASGESYDSLLQRRVYLSQHMYSTGPHRPSLGLAFEARGYQEAGSKWRPAVDWHMSQAGGAGELYSTVGDLQRWNEAVFGDHVLTPESRKKAHTPEPKAGSEAAGAFAQKYAFGWMADEVRGLKVISHSGGLHGFSSELRRYPDQKVTVTVLCNSMEGVGGLNTAMIADIAARQYLWREMSPQPCFQEEPLPEGVKLTDYVATFDFPGLGVLRSRVVKDSLQVRLASQVWSKVRPAGKDQFRNDSVDATFTFQRDDKGAIKGVKLTQHGAELEAARYAEPESVKPEPGQLAPLAGTYELIAGKMVFREDAKAGVLMGRLGGQPELAYFPVKAEPLRFFSKIVRVEILFTKSEDGKVTGFILQQGGAVLPAGRVEASLPSKK
ncbi:MAG: serine hydrolase, partial [Verrucomicrobium sp.]